MSSQTKRDGVIACGCALAVMAGILLCWPFGRIPIGDEFSYAFNALRLAQTGRMIYNGWSEPPVILQSAWGALLIRIFGFSFSALRMGVLPMAGACAALCYLLGRAAGLRRGLAVFASLALALSPMFVVSAIPFMTDIPSLAFILLCVLAMALSMQRVRETRHSQAIAWLIVALTAAIAGGLSRQTCWLPMLVLGPYAAWTHRRSGMYAIAALAAWLCAIAAMVIVTRWYNRQPATIPTRFNLIDVKILFVLTPHNLIVLLNLLLTTMLLSLPVAAMVAAAQVKHLWRIRATPFGVAAALALLILAGFLIADPHGGIEPWLPNVLARRGLLAEAELSGVAPLSRPFWVSAALSAATYAALALLAMESAAFGAQVRSFFRWLLSPKDGRYVAQSLALFAAAYLVSIFVRAAHIDWIMDRYAIPLLPCLSIPLLLRYQNAADPPSPRSCGPVMPVLGWFLLLVFGLYAIASCQSLCALDRAKMRAINALRAAGIPDNAIAAGVEWDHWIELRLSGRINNFLVHNPPWQKQFGETPSMRPRYRIEFSKEFNTVYSKFGDVDYFSLLPPFHRTILIDKFGPKWNSSSPRPPSPIGGDDYESYHKD